MDQVTTGRDGVAWTVAVNGAEVARYVAKEDAHDHATRLRLGQPEKAKEEPLALPSRAADLVGLLESGVLDARLDEVAADESRVTVLRAVEARRGE